MNEKVIATIIFSAIIIAACGPIPTTGGSSDVLDLSSSELAEQYGYMYVPPVDGDPFLNPEFTDDLIPATGGSPALESSGIDLLLSDEALVIQGLLEERNVTLFLFLPSGRDKSLSDEALELEES